MSEIIDVSQKHQDIFYTFLDDAKVFFDSDQGHKDPYTGITRLDGKAGLGYINKDIENSAYKESFAFNLRNDEVPFKVEKVVEAFQEIGFDYLRGIDKQFCDMHDDQPLVRIHKYNTDFEYMSEEKERRFAPDLTKIMARLPCCISLMMSKVCNTRQINGLTLILTQTKFWLCTER